MRRRPLRPNRIYPATSGLDRALTSYIVCSAIMMPLTGWLAGRFGIKHIFLASIVGFTIASALCGAATSLGELVAFRALQGVAGAGLIPLSQATLLQINPPERHGHAMAVFGVGTICGPIMGRHSAAG